MSDNIINGLNEIGKDKKIQQLSHLMPHGISQQFKQPPIPIHQAIRGDHVNISDEVKENEKTSSINIDALKDSISSIKQQLNTGLSNKDATPGLVNDAFSVQMERNGLQGAKAPVKNLGMKPGMHNGSVIGNKGIQEGPEPGMKGGAVYSSRRSNTLGYQPGGGLASPNMIKMQTDYAGALKEGAHISPEGEGMVLQNMANAGINAHPIRAMLGL